MEHTGQSRFVEFRVYRELDKRYDGIIENVQNTRIGIACISPRSV